MPNEPVVDKKIFSYAEAMAALPEIKRFTAEAARHVESLEESAVDGRLSPEARRDIDALVTAWAEAVRARGVEVKGLWLIDFDNGSGYYCWRHPEPGLHFFHSYEDGFSGRVPIQ